MSSIEVLSDPVRGWLARKENQKPADARFWPATDQQGAALDCDADILLLGGSAGSLKTSKDAMQQAMDLFPQTGARSRDDGREYVWPSGAHFRFRHLSHEKNLFENQGKAMTAIGVDESTHLPLDWIRYIFTRNRSTDPDIKTRLRLGTNPGNISSKDHQKMFFNNVCPHCEPAKAPPQGVLLWNQKWHDGIPLRDKDNGQDFSLAYILSSVRDHTLLGSAYQSKLKMQKPATVKALLAGCWKLFESCRFRSRRMFSD